MNNILSYENLGLVFLALLIAISGIYSYKLFTVLMPLLTIIVIWSQGGWKNISFYISPPLIFLSLLLIWGGISIFWTISPIPAIKTFSALAVTLVFAFLLISCLIKATPELISKAYIVITLAGFFLILFILFHAGVSLFYKEFFTGDLSRFDVIKPTGSILGLTIFVGCGFMLTQKNNFLFALWGVVLLSILAYLTRCQTAIYGIILASLMFILSYAMPFWMTRISMVSTYTFLLISPMIYTYIFPPAWAIKVSALKQIMNNSLFHRFLGWEFYSKKFFENPFWGWGMESSRYLPIEPNLAVGYDNLLHPHSNSAQAYAELGIVGGVLYAFFFASLFWIVEKNVKDRLSVAVCNATITFGFVAAEMTHNIWRNYWLSLAALTGGLIILFLKAREAQLHGAADHSRQFLAQ